MRKIALSALAPLAVLAAGCSAASAQPAAEPSSYVDYHFKSLKEMSDVVEKAGWSCGADADEVKTSRSLYDFGFASAPCDRGAINIYPSDAKRAEIEGKDFNALEPGKARIDGGNWEVVGDQYKVEDAQKLLGGTLTLGKAS